MQFFVCTQAVNLKKKKEEDLMPAKLYFPSPVENGK
jgi:hypothetical protein